MAWAAFYGKEYTNRNWRDFKMRTAGETVQACRRCGYESTSAWRVRHT